MPRPTRRANELAPAQSPATVSTVSDTLPPPLFALHELADARAREAWCSCGLRFSGRTRSVAMQQLDDHVQRTEGAGHAG